jgi:hypothetical protein
MPIPVLAPSVVIVERLSFIPAGGTHNVSVPYRPQTAGTHDLVLVADRGTPIEARGSIGIDVVSQPQGPGDDGDGCQLGRVRSATARSLLPLLGLLVFWVVRAVRQARPRRLKSYRSSASR